MYVLYKYLASASRPRQMKQELITSALASSAMSNLNLTQKWLLKEVARYPLKDIVYTDVDSALAAYPTLRPKTDIYSEPIAMGR